MDSILRQHLEARGQQEQEQELRMDSAESTSETDALLPQSPPGSGPQAARAPSYNSLSTTDSSQYQHQQQRPLHDPSGVLENRIDEDEEEDEENSGFQGYEENDDDDDSSEQSGDERAARESNLLERIWQKLKACFVLVVNVENLWDSPAPHSQNSVVDNAVSRRNNYVVLLWFFILASSYATERSTFKLLVDRTGPFRLVAVEMVTFAHATMVGMGMLISPISRRDFSIAPLGVPTVDVGLMALLDTIHLLMVFLTGLHVPPTLTAILVQFTLPLMAIITQFVHPDGAVKRCCGGRRLQDPSHGGSHPARTGSPNEHDVVMEYTEGMPLPGWGGLSAEHVLGSTIILLAVFLALCPAIYSILDPAFFIYADTIPLQTAFNTMLYVSSCIPAAASQLYKEHVFLQHKQPVQQDHLNFILSILQLIFASIMAPLVYTLQGMAASEDWPTLYPSSGFSRNFFEGLGCFFGLLDEDKALNGYEDEAQCNYSLTLVLLHAFAIIAIGVAVDKIVNAGATKVMYRGVSAGIIFAVTTLYIYDLNIPDFSYGPAIDSLNLVCLMLLVVGSEVYHRVSLQGATFETVFPEIENFYDDE